MQTNTQTLVELFAEACNTHGQLKAFTCMGQDLTYSQIDKLSDDFSAWLNQVEGLEKGDRVALQLPNLLQFPVCAIGILKAGLVIVNVNPLYSPIELKHQLNDSGAKLLIVLANTASNAAEIIKQTKVEQVVVTELADLHGPMKRFLINFMVKYVKKMVPAYHFTKQISFRRVLALGQGIEANQTSKIKQSAVTGDNENLAVLQYTGGTTGLSKGAMLSHRNLVSNMFQLKKQLEGECPPAGSVVAAPLPLYHIYAFTMNFVFGMHQGHQVILIPNPRDIPTVAKALKPYVINGFVGINTLYSALCKDKDFKNLDFSKLTICSSGGMALTEKIANDWYRLTGCRILEGYGLSEASPFVASACYRDYKQGVIGKAAPDTQVKIINLEQQEVVIGEIGEVCVKGPQIMQGYWQQEEETAKVLKDGWLHTGDLGFVDDQGYLKLVDRLKDLIIVSGFNVYPTEVEEHVCSHPDIREAAVIGIKQDDGCEIVKLFVVTDNTELKVDDIIAHCREGLAAYKVPKIIEFKQSLPKSNVGKVLRRELR